MERFRAYGRLHLLGGGGGQPGMVQCLTVNKQAQQYVTQRDSIVWVDLEEAIDELLGKVTQPLVRREVLGIIASQNTSFQLGVLAWEGEASCKSTLKKMMRRNMA